MHYKIGEQIKKYRKLQNLSQKEFANLINVSNSSVSNWEQGINRPDVDILVSICEVLDVSADVLLDIRVTNEEYTDIEKKVISQYRKKTSLQQAVNILLDIKKY